MFISQPTQHHSTKRFSQKNFSCFPSNQTKKNRHFNLNHLKMAPTTKIVLISVISFWLISSFQLAGCSRPGTYFLVLFWLILFLSIYFYFFLTGFIYARYSGFGVGGDTSISTQAQVMQRNGTVCFYCFCLYRIANEQRIPNESAAARVSNMRSFHCFVFVGNKSYVVSGKNGARKSLSRTAVTGHGPRSNRAAP